MVQRYGDDAYLHSGTYTYLTGPEEDRSPVKARFSFMWRKVDGDWKITHHHSSTLPGTPPGFLDPTSLADAPAPAPAPAPAVGDGEEGLESPEVGFRIDAADPPPAKRSWLASFRKIIQ